MTASDTPSDAAVAAAPEGPAPPIGEIVFALAVVALGAYALLDARTISVPLTAGALGPRAMPYIVGTLLVLSGGAVLLALSRGRRGHADDSEDLDPTANTDWLTVVLLVAVVLVHIALIRPIGWPFAATVLFAGVATVLGARPVWRAALIGLALALLIQIAMAGGLGVSLPAGPLLDGVSIFRG